MRGVITLFCGVFLAYSCKYLWNVTKDSVTKSAITILYYVLSAFIILYSIWDPANPFFLIPYCVIFDPNVSATIFGKFLNFCVFLTSSLVVLVFLGNFSSGLLVINKLDNGEYADDKCWANKREKNPSRTLKWSELTLRCLIAITFYFITSSMTSITIEKTEKSIITKAKIMVTSVLNNMKTNDTKLKKQQLGDEEDNIVKGAHKPEPKHSIKAKEREKAILRGGIIVSYIVLLYILMLIWISVNWFLVGRENKTYSDYLKKHFKLAICGIIIALVVAIILGAGLEIGLVGMEVRYNRQNWVPLFLAFSLAPTLYALKLLLGRMKYDKKIFSDHA